MNRKMRRMLAKKGGNIEGLMNNPEVASLLDGVNVSEMRKLMKDPRTKDMYKVLKKYKKETGTCICPECGKEMHYKGALCTCEHCGKFVVVEDLCGDELEDDSQLHEVLQILNSSSKEDNGSKPTENAE